MQPREQKRGVLPFSGIEASASAGSTSIPPAVSRLSMVLEDGAISLTTGERALMRKLLARLPDEH